MSNSLVIPVSLTNTPTLVKGSGFSGATGSFSAVGNSGASGYTENAICRWNVVPYQTFSGTLGVGIVAFHVEGILGVSFSVNGGNWFFVKTPTYNPDSKTIEYWCKLNASDYSDGQIEVRAIVYPVNGVPRTMEGSDYTAVAQSLFLYANSGGTYNPTIIYVASNGSDSNNGLTSGAPVQTLAHALDLVSNGGTVRIMTSGAWTLATVSSGPRFAAAYNYANWTTLEADSSFTKDQVTLTGSGRQFINHLRVHNLTIDAHSVYLYPEQTWQIWADGVVFFNSNGGGEVMNDSAIRYYQSGGTFQTNCTYNAMFFGPLQGSLIQNCACTNMGSDILNNALCVVNLTAANLSQLSPGTHNDTCQYFGVNSNIVVYGYTASNATSYQGIFFDQAQSSSFRDIAVVNFSFGSIDGDGPPFTQFASPERHILLQNFYNPWQTMLWRTDLVPDGQGNSVPFSGTNFKLLNCTVNNATYTTLRTGVPGVTDVGTVNSGL